MSATPTRLLLRQAYGLGRRSGQRHASTTSQVADAASATATKTKDGASNATSKASQGLSRVTSSAGSALSGAAQGVSNTIGRIGGRTGRLISFVECECEFKASKMIMVYLLSAIARSCDPASSVLVERCFAQMTIAQALDACNYANHRYSSNTSYDLLHESWT